MLGSLLGAWAYLLRWPVWKGQVNLFRMGAHQSNSPRTIPKKSVPERGTDMKHTKV